MSKYYLVEITGQKEILEELQSCAMTDFACDGVEEFSIDESTVDSILGDRAYSGGDIPLKVINEVEAVTKDKSGLVFKYYFYNGESENKAEVFLNFVKDNYGELKAELLEKEDEDWNAKWKEHYSALKVSDKLTIVPEWEKDNYDNDSSVYIYPGMGFGTGNHETTFLCLSIFEKMMEQGIDIENVLDFGCGSGILGVAAAKRAQAIVDFCDIDRDALENTLQNLKLNFEENLLNGHSLVIRDRLNLTKEYDLVFANILEHILILEQETIISNLKNGGHLILSGLLNDQVENISDVYKKKQFEIRDVVTKGEWSAIHLVRC